MAAYKEITLALRNSLIGLNLGYPIAYEGRDFDPESVDGIFISESFLYDTTESLTKTTLDEIRGIYQLSLYQRANDNILDVIELIDVIANAYVHNTKLVNGSQTVVIINTSRNQARIDGAWRVVDVSINFKSDKLRA